MREVRNYLIRSLARHDRIILQPSLEYINLTLRLPFEVDGAPIERVCFPDDGVVSVVARSVGLRQVEAGLVGFEGMTGLSLLLGDDRAQNETYVQMAGYGHVIEADALRAALRASTTLKDHLLKFALTFMVQVSQTALANGRDRIDMRLARWLLMASDRVRSPDLMLTHDFMAIMLGVRRPGVTDALHRLEGNRLIRSKRGVATILDRPGMEQLAGPSYGMPETEYRRLLGDPAALST